MNKERIKQYDQLYMSIAVNTSQMSYATRNKVGCVIVKDHNIIAYGYNGMPMGMDNECEYINELGELVTRKEVMHSELNAIHKAVKQGISPNGSTIYITLSPCFNCSLQILSAGIKKVFYREEYRDSSGIDFLKNRGIEVEKI